MKYTILYRLLAGGISMLLLGSTSIQAEPSDRVRAQRFERSDAAIERVLEERLAEKIPHDQIRATVNDGLVALTGTVDSLPEKRLAEEVASLLRGVVLVRNDLEVADSGIPDHEILKDVLASFRANPAVDSSDLQVEVNNGVVTIRGDVSSYAEKWIAGQIAANINGVRGLNNNLILHYVESRPDDEILADIKSRLSWDAKVDASRVRVRVDDGNVTLAGAVDSPVAKMWARFDAWVAGVESVDSSQLSVRPDPRTSSAGYYQADYPNPGPRVTDLAIQQAVRNSFLYHPALSMAPFVKVNNGVVTLGGSVNTLRAKRIAEKVASEITGVDHVVNHLRVIPGSIGRGDLVESIAAAFERDPYLEKLEIRPRADNGTITLGGYVDSEFEKERAAAVAAGVPGVQAVINQLQVASETNPVYRWQYASQGEAAENADQQLREEIEDELFWSPYVEASRVDVITRNGTAILRGTVASGFARQKAVENAYEAGALSVRNQLQIQGNLEEEEG